jgi:hypothetical protein
MDKNQDFEPYIEKYKLKEQELIAFIQGKSLHFMLPNKYHIEIIPPNHGITLDYKDWENVKRLLLNTVHPRFVLDKILEQIEKRK